VQLIVTSGTLAFSFSRQYGILRDLTTIRNYLLKIATALKVIILFIIL